MLSPEKVVKVEMVKIPEKVRTGKSIVLIDHVGLAASGCKSELVVRLALWTHKSTEARAGRLELRSMTNSELQELSRSLMPQFRASRAG